MEDRHKDTETRAQEAPLVTVITPAYNRASLLDETILSVLNQEYPNLEYIVLDDGSTDATLSVIKGYEDRIRWDTHKNMGETNTVNRGLSMAKGEILGVVNSDDPLLPGAINEIIKYITAVPETIVAYPDWKMIDENGGTVQYRRTFSYNYIDMLRWHHCMPGPGTFFRREIAEKLHGRDSQFRYVADFDFWLRAGLLGRFVRVPKTLATFRMHSDSATVKQNGAVMAEEHIRLVNKIYGIPDLPPEVLKVRKEAYSSAYYTAGVVCGNDVKAKGKYYAEALGYAPMKYAVEYRRRIAVMMSTLLGLDRAQSMVMKFLSRAGKTILGRRKNVVCL